jgi:hypothetical protein
MDDLGIGVWDSFAHAVVCVHAEAMKSRGAGAERCGRANGHAVEPLCQVLEHRTRRQSHTVPK